MQGSERWRSGMEGDNEEEESCREWMSQTGSIRGLTADGKSHHRATQVELTSSLKGDWRYGDGEIAENKNGKLMGMFSIAVVNTTSILISCDCPGLTMWRPSAAFWRPSASVAACADPPVMIQADCDRVSERERRDWLKTPVRELNLREHKLPTLGNNSAAIIRGAQEELYANMNRIHSTPKCCYKDVCHIATMPHSAPPWLRPPITCLSIL